MHMQGIVLKRFALLIVVFALVLALSVVVKTMTVGAYYDAPPARVLQVQYHGRTVIRITPTDKSERWFLLQLMWCSAPTRRGICYATIRQRPALVHRSALVTVTTASPAPPSNTE